MIAPALIPFVVIALMYYQALEAEGCHLSCDFDKNLCDYEQSTDDDADWIRIQGETPSSDTGPSSDHTSGGGWYMYFEASNPRKEGDFADLRGPVVPTNSSSEECVTFYYHMRGISMGSLKVLTYKNQPFVPSYKEIWKIEGQQSKNGTDWKRAKISIKETDPYELVFRATRGSRYFSDIGLDDIGMSHKACEIPCPGLPQIPNGHVVISASQPYEVGTEVVWTCNSGYILRGHREANCLESGHWSAEPPSCEAITCPKMPQIRNGRVEVEGLPPYAVGSGASFTCDEGYVTTGPSLLICLESGKWSGTPTSCSAPTCLRDTSKLEPGRRCRGRCQGNGPSGQCGVLPNVCRCDGWCGMSCLNPNRKCPVLSNPEHGSVTFKGRKYGQIARYKCDPGFSLVGSSERSCRSDRKWSGVAPLCFPYGACGLTEETKVVRKIIRGSNARQGAWPWHVLVSHNRGKGLVQDIIGGGSLIGEKWVLSAAINFDVDFRDQILSKQWKGSFLIVLGMTKSWKNDQELPDYVQIYEPAMVYLHPEFSIINFDFDVALIRIGPKMMQLSNGSYGVDESSSGGKVTFSRFVRPVCLPCVKDSITSPSDAWKNFDAQLCSRKGVSSIFPVGSDAVITGFGITKWGDFHSRPDGLQEGHVQVNDDAKCTKYVETLQRDHASEFARYTDQMLCAAGGTGSTRIDSCHGDGGGPLVKKQVQIHEGRKIEYWIQIGISSWGPRKCGAEIPGFYTSVPAVMKWIWKTLDANSDRCKRDLSKLETGRKCPAPCQRDDQCTGPAECLCDGSCGMSCVDRNAKCPQLGELENGSIIIPGRTYGSEVTYRCDSGFSVIGPWTRTCRSDRKWSGIAPSCVLLSACGQSEGPGGVKKIVRGSDAKRGAWPWQAILSHNRPGSLVKNIAGAGSLINEEWVLSAAHVIDFEFTIALVTGNWTGSFIIALGLTNHWRSELPDTVQVFEPKSVHIHPQFNRDNHDFDVVLIRIGRNMRRLEDGGFAVVENSPDGKVIYSHFVRPVCLPCVTGVLSKRVDVWMNFDADLCMDKGKYIMSAIAPPGSEAVITGFGYTNYSNPTAPEVLQEGRIKIFSDLECAKDVEEVKSVFPTANYTDQMLCGSGGTESAKVDACLGDAGGPLVRKQVELRRGKTIESWVQVGIVSWGLGCAERHGFYTSVPSVMKWIWQTLDHVRNEGTPCASRPCHSKAFCTTKNKHQFICTCKSGYTGDGKFCRKILPCDSSPCHPNATCFDDGESRFVCSCNEGYQGDGKVCKNQCGPNQYYTKCGTPCPPNCGRQNSEGCRRGCNSDQRCFCKQGYVERSETDKTCIPVDSCPQNQCGRDEIYTKCGTKCPATCKDPNPENCDMACNSHQHCFCTVGYVQKSDSDKTCIPVDSCPRSMPCDLKPCHINANCWNGEIAGYLCQCKKGYTGDGKLCTKILPCDSNPCDQNADCKNERGNRFTCKCRNGYTGNGDTCTKILPCDSNPCDQNADCRNERGNRFTCKCRNGYKGDGDTCTKILPCDSNPCDENADCKNERGNRFTCKCRDGYRGDGDTCTKILPCDSKPCDQNADCKNELGNRFTCKCRNGYRGDGNTCTKILPCDSKPCDQNADCKNERGNRFSCKCRNGYRGDGNTCTKILPCDSNPCDENADCKNERGNRFSCKCRNGYRGDGDTCTKILPCDSNPCDENADCKNERGNRFSCKCRNGFKGDGETCAKILPCDSNPCDQNADCQNELAGRFSCKCMDGFQGDGETCKQILPCDKSPCDRNAECKNERNNRYSCKCKGGYEGDGETCTSTESIWGQWTSWKECDVTCGSGHQERTRACLGSGDCVGHDFETERCNSQNCEESKTTCGGCHADATCVKLHNNRHGCVCKIGYKGDGKFCKKMHCPNIDDIRHGHYRTSSEAPYAVGAVANFGCDVGFKANGKFRLTCLIGGRWSAPIPYCIANVCKRDLRRIEQGRKCRKPCKQDSQCKGAFKRCQCDDWCGRSCFNPNADCVQLTQPKNGYIIENGRSYGQAVTYGCDEGYTLNGPSTRICRSDRTWSGHPPICLPYSACGQSVEVRGSSSFGKVRGGSNAKQGAWPWQALLIHHLKRTVEEILDMQKVFGGGSIINDEWILSAAHVFDNLFYLSTESNKWDNTFLIILGMTNYPKPGHGIPDHFQIFQPQDVHLHPKFNPQSFDYDIALIRVGKRVTSDGKTSFKVGGVHESRKITFTRYVRPVCLPCMKEDPAKLLDVIEGYSKKICPREGAFTISPNMKNTIMVTGFGRTAHNGSFFPTTLQQGTLKIRDKLTCSESLNDIRYYNEHARYTERMFCASSANDSLKVDACQGDSGGPVVVKMKSDQKVEYWRQIGIVSWGFKCADKHPGFYTSVYSFMDWIWKILDDEKKAVVCGEKFFRDDSHYNVTSCPAGLTVGSKCSLKCANGYKWTLEESVWNAKCTLKGSSDSIAEWDFHNAPICEI